MWWVLFHCLKENLILFSRKRIHLRGGIQTFCEEICDLSVNMMETVVACPLIIPSLACSKVLGKDSFWFHNFADSNHSMKTLSSVWLVSFVLWANLVSVGQNLIPNPGFEQCDRCDNRGFYELGIGRGANDPTDWNSATYGSPDIYSTVPHTGKRHGGFFTGPGKFEYLANQFNEPLKQGATYQFSFWVRAHPQFSSYIVDEIGVYILQGSTAFKQSDPLSQFKPSFTTPDGQFIPPKDYLPFKFEYVACGGEDHFIVGRFNKLMKGDSIYIGPDPSIQSIYYYVDDFEMIEVKPPLQEDPIALQQIDLCKDSVKTIRVHDAYVQKEVRWSTGERGPTVQIKNLDTLWVEIHLNDACNTILRDTLYIRYFKDISMKILSTDSICTGDSISLQALCNGDCFEYLWNTGQTDRVIRITQPGLYTVKAKTVCYDLIQEKEILAKDGHVPDFIQLPNVITRSGAAENQVFKAFVQPGQKHRLQSTSWNIFNRWGVLVDEKSGLDLEWRPDSNVSPDTYLYQFMAKYQDCNATNTKVFKGHVILLD